MNKTQEKTDITCYVCKSTIVKPNGFTTGYGSRMINPDDEFDPKKAVKICYACCAKEDFASMLKTGKFVGYLTMDTEVTDSVPSERDWRGYFKPSRHSKFKRVYVKNIRVTNWPGSLKLKVYHMRIGSHNMANCRYDVWFEVLNPETNRLEKWHGVCYGDGTQICRCKRTKDSIDFANRLNYLRDKLREEHLSYDDIVELEHYRQFSFIPSNYPELLEATGVPE